LGQIRYEVTTTGDGFYWVATTEGKVPFMTKRQDHADWLANTLNGLMELPPLFLDPDMLHAEAAMQVTAEKFVSAYTGDNETKGEACDQAYRRKNVAILLLRLVRKCRELVKFKA
jgi:hypothetical protein